MSSEWIKLKEQGWSSWKEYGEERTTIVIYFSVEINGMSVANYRATGHKGGHRWSVTSDDHNSTPVGVFRRLRDISDHFYYRGSLSFSVPYHAEEKTGLTRGPEPVLELSFGG